MPPGPPVASAARPRIVVVDWLRGIAVLLMILAHTFDAWMDPVHRHGFAWAVVRHASGIPSRLFLFLVGVSSAIGFESQLQRGLSSAQMRRGTLKRGLQVLVLAYLFRLQEHILAGFWGGWMQVVRVDILNCIGASLIVLALVGTPRAGRPRYALPLALAAIFLAFGAIIGPAVMPAFIPRPLSAYVGGQRPVAWFPLFPWGAWALVGLVVGHLWLRRGRDRAGQARCFLVTGAVGAVLVIAVLTTRALAPDLIHYPSEVVQQMGPGSFFFRLGIIALIACAGWLITRWQDPARFSVVRQLGQTSLLIYWVHVEICYGFGTRPLQKQLTLPQAFLAYLLLCAAMLGLSVVKTRHGRAIGAWLRQRLRRARAADKLGQLA